MERCQGSELIGTPMAFGCHTYQNHQRLVLFAEATAQAASQVLVNFVTVMLCNIARHLHQAFDLFACIQDGLLSQS